MTETVESLGTHEVHHPSELRLYYKNPRRGDVDAIAASLRANSQYKPISVNRGTHTGRKLEVLAGNHTMLAFRQLAEKYPDEERWQNIDCWVVDVDEDAAKRIVAADNRTSELGTFDAQGLLDLLGELPDLDGTGYTDDDLAAMLRDNTPPEEKNDKDDVPLPPKEPTSKPGDVWQLGPHRLLNGDSTDVSAVEAMMDGDKVDMIWTDPPYGVSYVGKTKDALEIQNDKPTDLAEMLSGAFTVIMATAKGGAPIYMTCPPGPEFYWFTHAFRESGCIWRQTLMWAKNVMVMGRSDYHYKHEPILYGFTPNGAGRLGRGGERWYGDNRPTSVFEVDKPRRNGDHPTMKPVDLIVMMMENSLPKGGLVLDLFGGSGSTMIAAHHHGSAARLVELDPRYADVICRRWQEHSGQKPVLVSTGEEHDFTRYVEDESAASESADEEVEA